MLPRFLLFVILPLTVVFLLYKALNNNVPVCKRCRGNGYWKGARGESNRCEACGGKGY